MAATTPAATQTETAAPAKKRGWLLIAILLGVVALAGGGAAWYFTRPEAPQAEAKPRPPVFVPLETFTVNLQPEGAEQFLQVEMTLRVTSDSVRDQIKLHMPELRNRLLMVLSEQRPSELMSAQGKERLGAAVVAAVNEVLRGRGTPPAPVAEAAAEAKAATPAAQPVQAVFFTSFIIQ